MGVRIFYPIVKHVVQDGRPPSRAGRRSLHSTRPNASLPPLTTPEDTFTTLLPGPSDPREADLLQAAFRDLHGARLHGFALLLTIGDRSRAADAATVALAAGAVRAAELRHPERAAAWLRARLLRIVRRTGESRRHSRAERRNVLLELGMPEAMMAGLEGLTLNDRAALVAASVERFAITDVATILGRDAATTRRILQAARQRYLAATTLLAGDQPASALPGGEIAARIEQVAARAIGPRVAESLA
jgi:DNA-directed RNA polymerase specialized sigma24 family protein